MMRTVLFIALGLTLATPACSPSSPARDNIPSMDVSGLDEVVEQQSGQVVLVEFWGTWCGPCIELFSHTTAMQRELRDRGFVVITVAIEPSAQHAAARRVLKEHGQATKNFFASYGLGPEAFEAFRISDGALPHLRLYDRQGRLTKTFTSGSRAIEPKQLRQAVDDLLK